MPPNLVIPGLRADLLQQSGGVSFGVTGARSIQRTTRLPLITSFTLCGWIFRQATPSAYQQIVTFGKNDASTDYYALYSTPNDNTITCWNGTTEIGTAGATPIGSWKHIAMTVAGTGASQVVVYVDGAAIITGSGNGNPAAGRILICDAPDSPGLVFQGAYAWWSVYDRPLTVDEIKLHMRSPWHPSLSAGLNTVLRLNNPSDPGMSAFGDPFTKNGTVWLPIPSPPVAPPSLAPRVSYIFGASSGVTGTGSAAAQSFGASATGTETLAGTGSSAAAAFAASGTAAANVTGTASAALPSPSVAATGTESFTGTGSAAMRPPGSLGSDGSTIPVVEYRIDEAASGQAPASLFDSRPSPVNLAINYVGGTPAFGADGDGRYLGFAGNIDQAVAASVALDTGNKVFDAIDGSTEATLEFVANLTFPQSVTGDISNIFGIGQDDGENDVIQCWLWEGSQQHIEVDFTTSAGYPSGYYKRSGDIADIPAGTNIFHCIFDTDNATEADRIRLYVTPIGGSRSRITLATSNDGTASIPQHAQIDVPTPNNSGGPTGPNHTQHVLIGNWIDYFAGNGGLKGKVYYAAIYDRVLTSTEMDAAGTRIGDVLNAAAAAMSPMAVSATGTETLTGTGTAAAQPMSVTAAGAETMAGTGLAALPPLAGVATGVETFTGTVSAAAAPASTASSGTETFLGSGSGATAPNATSGSGAETFAGSAAALFASFAVSAAALEQFVAAATAAATAFAVNAAGDGVFSGTGSGASSPFAATAAGVLTFQGTAGAALATFSIEADGTETIGGIASAAASAFASVASALETFAATASADLAAFAAAASGTATGGGVSGDGTAAMSVFAAAASAAETFNGVIAATLSAFSAASGVAPIPGMTPGGTDGRGGSGSRTSITGGSGGTHGHLSRSRTRGSHGR